MGEDLLVCLFTRAFIQQVSEEKGSVLRPGIWTSLSYSEGDNLTCDSRVLKVWSPDQPHQYLQGLY